MVSVEVTFQFYFPPLPRIVTTQKAESYIFLEAKYKKKITSLRPLARFMVAYLTGCSFMAMIVSGIPRKGAEHMLLKLRISFRKKTKIS